MNSAIHGVSIIIKFIDFNFFEMELENYFWKGGFVW